MVTYQHSEADVLRTPTTPADRADRAATGPQAQVWYRFTAFKMSDRWRAVDVTRAAVLSNLVDIVAIGDAQDFLTLSALINSHGHERVADIHRELDLRLGFDESLPVTRDVLRTLGAKDSVRELLVGAGVGPDAADAVTTTCYRHMFWLLLSGSDELGPAPVVDSAEALVNLLESGGIPQWRALLAPVADNPWAPVGDRLARLAEEAGRPDVVQALVECRVVYKARQEERERSAIAREIRRLVAVSGRSQREFASYVGTSPSRLSTYATGKVTPSAAMLLRIQRASRVLQDQGRDR